MSLEFFNTFKTLTGFFSNSSANIVYSNMQSQPIPFQARFLNLSKRKLSDQKYRYFYSESFQRGNIEHQNAPPTNKAFGGWSFVDMANVNSSADLAALLQKQVDEQSSQHVHRAETEFIQPDCQVNFVGPSQSSPTPGDILPQAERGNGSSSIGRGIFVRYHLLLLFTGECANTLIILILMELRAAISFFSVHW